MSPYEKELLLLFNCLFLCLNNIAYFFPTQTQFDESKVTLGPNRGGKGWKSGSGSGTRTGSSGGGYSSSSSREHLDTSNPTSRASTPTMINRFSALAGSNADQTSPYMARKTNSRYDRNRNRLFGIWVSDSYLCSRRTLPDN